MVGTTGMIWPSPRLRTLMDESVRLGTANVPACVALSSPGGGRVVNLGSQRMLDAVVSWLAMRRVERASSAVGAGAWCAVVGEGEGRGGRCSEGRRRRCEGEGAVVIAIDEVPFLCGGCEWGAALDGCASRRYDSAVGRRVGPSACLARFQRARWPLMPHLEHNQTIYIGIPWMFSFPALLLSSSGIPCS